jgi:hypothetical protein
MHQGIVSEFSIFFSNCAKKDNICKRFITGNKKEKKINAVSPTHPMKLIHKLLPWQNFQKLSSGRIANAMEILKKTEIKQLTQ